MLALPKISERLSTKANGCKGTTIEEVAPAAPEWKPPSQRGAPPPHPVAGRKVGTFERPITRIESIILYLCHWGDSAGPGPLYFLLHRKYNQALTNSWIYRLSPLVAAIALVAAAVTPSLSLLHVALQWLLPFFGIAAMVAVIQHRLNALAASGVGLQVATSRMRRSDMCYDIYLSACYSILAWACYTLPVGVAIATCASSYLGGNVTGYLIQVPMMLLFTVMFFRRGIVLAILLVPTTRRRTDASGAKETDYFGLMKAAGYLALWAATFALLLVPIGAVIESMMGTPGGPRLMDWMYASLFAGLICATLLARATISLGGETKISLKSVVSTAALRRWLDQHVEF